MTDLPDRYAQLLAIIPSGSFYEADGYVLPFRDDPQDLPIATTTANRAYGVTLDGVFVKEITTDANGNATLQLTLSQGRHEIQLEDDETAAIFRINVTVRASAVFHAALAQILGELDQHIEDEYDARSLDSVTAAYIEPQFGRLVAQGFPSGWTTDTYREAIRQLRLAYRHFCGHPGGIALGVQALTSSRALVVPKLWVPRWALGYQMQPARLSLESHARGFNTTTPLSNINNSTEDFATLVSIGGYSVPGVASIDRTDPGLEHVLAWRSGPTTSVATITTSGTTTRVTLRDASRRARIFGIPTDTFTIIGAANDRFVIDVDDLGPVTVTLTAGVRTAAQVSQDINSALAADARYGAAFATSGASEVARQVLNFAYGGVSVVRLKSPTTGVTSRIHLESVASRDALPTIFGLPRARTTLASQADPGETTLTIASANERYPTSGDYDVRLRTPDDASREVVRVTGRSGATLTLQSAVVGTHPVNTIVDLVSEMPHDTFGYLGLDTVTLDIKSDGLADNGADTPTVVGHGVTGGGVPDGWNVSNISAVRFAEPGYFAPVRHMFLVSGNNPKFRTSIPEVVNYKGLTLRAQFWVSQHAVAAASRSFKIQFCFNSTFDGAFDGTFNDGTAVTGDTHPKSIAGVPICGGANGTGDSFTAAGVTTTLADAGGSFGLHDLGRFINISGATTTKNNGRFVITAVPSSTSVQFTNNLVGVTEAFTGTYLIDLDGPANPTLVQAEIHVPYNATSCDVQLTSTDLVNTEYFSVERAAVWCVSAHAPFLGVNTLPNTAKRMDFGRLIYVWSHDELTSAEKLDLGLPQPKTGTGDTLSVASGTVTLTDTAATFGPEDVGRLLHVLTATNAANEGQFEILTVPSTTTLTFANASGVTETSSFTYQIGNAAIPERAGSFRAGHIDRLGAVHGAYDRFDVTEYDTGVSPAAAKNILGAYTYLEWLGATRTNMSLVLGTPTRMSYARATLPSKVTKTGLATTTDGAGGGLITFESSWPDSDHEGSFPQLPNTHTQLIEITSAGTRIPVPVGAVAGSGTDGWVMNSARIVRVRSSSYSASSTYELEYEQLTRVDTAVIDLGTARTDYVWMLDVASHIRREIEAASSTRAQLLSVLTDLQAKLLVASDQDKSTSVLMMNDGVTETQVADADWSYIDGSTVQINPLAFNANALYTLTYEAQSANLARTCRVLVARRWGSVSVPDGTWSAWTDVWDSDTETTPPDIVVQSGTNAVRYHQLRATLSGVETTTDARIFALGLKGVHLYGASPSAPGLLV